MKKVLAIDDQKDNLVTIRAVLKKFIPNCKVFVAQSGKDGLEIAEKEQPDAILLDIIMPKMDGYDVCKKLKENETTKNIPVIMLTVTQSDTESKIKGLEAGADAFFIKPIEPIELTAQINVMFRIKEAEDKLHAERELLDETVKKRTKELEISEEKYRVLIETAKDSIFITDESGRFINVNQEACKSLGYTKEELLKIKISDIDVEVTGYEAFKTVRDGMKEKMTFEVNQIRKDGTLLPVEITGSSYTDGGKKFTMAIARDITGRKKAEKALQESEEKYRSIFENTGTASVIVEENSIISLANSKFAELSGYSCKEIEGQKYWIEFIVPEDLERMKKRHELRRKNGSFPPKTYEFRFVARNGDIKDILLNVDVIPGTQKSIASLLDITDRKIVEEALKEGKKRFKKLSNLTFEGILIHNNGVAIDVNESLTRIFGYTREEIIGRNAITLLVQREYHATIEKNMVKNRTKSYDVIARKKDGTLFPIEIEAKDLKGKDEGSRVAAIRDITERKQTEAELAKYRENLEDFVQERTKELEEKNEKLKQFNKLFVDREFRIKELKDRVKELEGKMLKR